MTAGPAKKEDHQTEDAKGKKMEIKKPEIVPVEKLIDALQEGAVTTITEIAKHMDVYGDAKPKIEEVLKETAKIEEVLRTLPRKKATEHGTKVKPNKEEIRKIEEEIPAFAEYVTHMKEEGKRFSHSTDTLTQMSEGNEKIEHAKQLFAEMEPKVTEIKRVNDAVQALIKNEQYVFVKQEKQNMFEEALAGFMDEFIRFTYIINYAVRHSVQNEENKTTWSTIKKETLNAVKAIADVSEKNIDKFRAKKEEIVQLVKHAKGLENLIKEEEKEEQKQLDLLQKDAEQIVNATRNAIKEIVKDIKAQDDELTALTSLETIETKKFEDLQEKLNAIEKSIPIFIRLYQRKQEISRTPTPPDVEREKELTQIETTIKAKKEEVKSRLDALKADIRTEQTLGTKQALRLNNIVHFGEDIIEKARKGEESFQALHQFLESERGKAAFKKPAEVHTATTDIRASLGALQEIVNKELEERAMFGTVGAIMKERKDEEAALQQEIDRFKGDDELFQNTEQITKYLPPKISRVRVGIEAIKDIEQALVQKLANSKEQIENIQKKIEEINKNIKILNKLLPKKGLLAEFFNRFRR